MLQKFLTKDIHESQALDFTRSGLVPYFISNNTTYYFFSIDSSSGYLIDMGGTIEYGDFIKSGIRELQEESADIFQFEYNDVIDYSISIYDEKTIISFQKVELDLDKAEKVCRSYRKKYLKLLQNSETPSYLIENTHIVYISEKDLLKLCKNEKVEIPYDYELEFYPEIYPLIFEHLKFGFKGYSGLLSL